jgi:hypothetical protein
MGNRFSRRSPTLRTATHGSAGTTAAESGCQLFEQELAAVVVVEIVFNDPAVREAE